MKNLIFIIGALLIFGSCGKDAITVDEQFAIDIDLIEAYIKEKNLTTEKTIDGVYYIIENPGTDLKPKVTNTLKVNYKGYFLDGTVFDSANNAELPLYVTIQGWQIGMPKFGKGGKGKLLIPSKFGYGTASTPGRANAVLGFDIEILDF